MLKNRSLFRHQGVVSTWSGQQVYKRLCGSVADYLKRPVIEDVDVSSYRGREGDAIVVRAYDVARTLTVTVRVVGADGHVVEESEALSAIFTNGYVFRASRRDDSINGSAIRVTVRDRPGNAVGRDVVLM